MAHSPTGWARPGLVTWPTPSPPRRVISSPGWRVTAAVMERPWVASMSSPPSLVTEQNAVPPSRRGFSTGTSTTQPLGVRRETRSGACPVRSRQAAPWAARAAQVPVV